MVAEEENKKAAKPRGGKRGKENGGIVHMRLSGLHSLYFASWYLYLNSDGVTYEGGTHRTKRDRTKEPRRKPEGRIGRGKRGGCAGGWGRRSDEARPGSLALCRSSLRNFLIIYSKIIGYYPPPSPRMYVCVYVCVSVMLRRIANAL